MCRKKNLRGQAKVAFTLLQLVGINALLPELSPARCERTLWCSPGNISRKLMKIHTFLNKEGLPLSLVTFPSPQHHGSAPVSAVSWELRTHQSFFLAKAFFWLPVIWHNSTFDDNICFQSFVAVKRQIFLLKGDICLLCFFPFSSLCWRTLFLWLILQLLVTL